MTNYLIKRVLIMIPTFFVISCIIFAVLNLSPGRPSFLSADAEGKSEISQGTQEVYRVFKAQFHLDKPVLFNTRFALSNKEVEQTVKFLASIYDKNAAEKQDAAFFKKWIRARDNMEDWGLDSVPQLIATLKDKPQGDILCATVDWLSRNAQKPFKFDFSSEKANERFIAENQQIEVENKELREMRYPRNSPTEKASRVADAWIAWYGEHEQEFRRSFLDKMWMFFCDTRFAYYWRNLFCLDFGVSHVTKKPVFPTVISKVPYSAGISLIGILLAYFIAVPIGIYSAVRRGSRLDKITTGVLFMLYALPSFFAATLALKYFGGEGASVAFLFPTGGLYTDTPRLALSIYGNTFDNLDPHWQVLDVCWHLALPVLMFTYGSLAALSRYARSGLLEVVNSDYVRTARAKGLDEKTIILRHMVRNGMIPILTLLGSVLPIAISGSIIIEYIFNIPGIGQLMITSIGNRDYNTILCISLISSALTLIGILLSDISYALLDPRIRYH
jgi:peptide/nickel transport system permease protein